VQTCAAVVVTMVAFEVSHGYSERVTLWSVRVRVAYVLCAVPCRRGGHDGRSLSMPQLQRSCDTVVHMCASRIRRVRDPVPLWRPR
jgi:hypothetical protein